MKTALILFPGSNREHDAERALRRILGTAPIRVWHGQTSLPPVDLVVLPGGFSYGDYLRAGAIAARAPIVPALHEHVARGGLVLGICNGFQILTEAGLLPGALMRNAGLRFVCRDIDLVTERIDTPFSRAFTPGQIWRCPVAHHDGNYVADAETLARLEGEGQIVFRYASDNNPNGSAHDIAGIIDSSRRVLGLMPHPENAIEACIGGADGRAVFESLLEGVPS